MISTPTIVITIILSMLTLMLPRKYFLAPYIIAACFVPTDQRLLIFGLDFTVLRILIVVGVVRLCLLEDLHLIKINRFDKILLLWAFCGAAIYVAQWRDMRALIYKCGVLFDVIGLYWLFRQNIRSWDNIIFIFKILALCCLILTPFIVYELTTGSNPFSVFGLVGTVTREGRYRCQASFPHSIMLGLFWASVVPVFIGLGFAGYRKYFFWAAAAAGTFIVFSTFSSTPIGTIITVIPLMLMFRYRKYGRQAAWSICGLLLALHLMMNNPVWHLLCRIHIISGSTGWHRFLLIDQTVKHFNDWALLGTRSTEDWGRRLFDITNQYCLEAVRGGLITLLLFVALLIVAVRITHKFSLSKISLGQQWLVWCICVSVLGHCISFIGVSYFGQIHMLLYLTFAIIALICEMSDGSFMSQRITNSV